MIPKIVAFGRPFLPDQDAILFEQNGILFDRNGTALVQKAMSPDQEGGPFAQVRMSLECNFISRDPESISLEGTSILLEQVGR